MGFSVFAAVATLLVIFVTYLLVWVLRRLRRHQHFSRCGIPGPKPGLLLGNCKELESDPIKVFDEWSKKYGKVFGYFEGEKPHLMTSDVDLIKECFIKESQTFQDRPRFPLDAEPFSSSLIVLRGEEWKGIRAKLSPCFSGAKMKLLMPIMDQCTDTFLKVLDDYAAKNNSVDIDVAAQALTLDVISKVALALQVNCQEDANDPLFQSVRVFFRRDKNFALLLATAFPTLSSLIGALFSLTSQGKFIDHIVDNVRAVINLRNQPGSPRAADMVQAMLDQVGQDGHGVAMEDRHVLANSFLFLIAGFDTTAVTLSFVTYCLAKYPQEQEKVYEEFSKMVPDDEGFNYDNIRDLKYLDAVVNESLRMYPTVATFTSRLCEEGVTVRGIHIPAETNVVVPTWQLHHDPELWSDPHEFRPERFLQEDINPAAFLPFGLGQRMCIGKRFALLEMKLALCKILRKYRVTLSDAMHEPLKLVMQNTLVHAKNGIHVTLKLRDPEKANE